MSSSKTQENISDSDGKTILTPIVFVGHVDHGKSTLIGRLLYDTKSLPQGKVEEIVESSRRRGLSVEWSFLLDSLQIERNQGVTVDSTRIPFQIEGRDFVIIDAPGHKQFLRNMITGASNVGTAVVVVDVAQGVQEQTRRHSLLLKMMGVQTVIVLLNKADTIGFDQNRIEHVQADIRQLYERLSLEVSAIIPACAREGDNIAHLSENMPWYLGPTLLQAIENVAYPSAHNELPFRMSVQDVYRFDDQRFVAGRVDRGVIREGDEIMIGAQKQRAQIAEICRWHAPHLPVAGSGESIALRFVPDIVPDRGDVLYLADDKEAQPCMSARVRARIFWLRRDPLLCNERFILRINSAQYHVYVASIERIIDIDHLTIGPGEEVPADGFAEVVLVADRHIVFDPFKPGLTDGEGVLLDSRENIVAAAPIIGAAPLPQGESSLHPTMSKIGQEQRYAKAGQIGCVFWMTGLPGSGKSTIARGAEQQLFSQSMPAIVLDGDNMRRGLCSDLGFSMDDRRENIRRVAYVAQILASTGQIVIVSLVSPLRKDREFARDIVGESFHEIHIDTPLDICRKRDPKGLYQAAQRGEIKDFTGVTSPYEAPKTPNMIINGQGDTEQNIFQLIDYVKKTIQ